MKVWLWAKAAERCGGCGAVIGQGELYIAWERVGWRTLKRCVACAESTFGMTPPDFVQAPPPPAPREPNPPHSPALQNAARVMTMRRIQRTVRQAPTPKYRPSRGPRPATDVFDPKMAAAGRDD